MRDCLTDLEVIVSKMDKVSFNVTLSTQALFRMPAIQPHSLMCLPFASKR